MTPTGVVPPPRTMRRLVLLLAVVLVAALSFGCSPARDTPSPSAPVLLPQTDAPDEPEPALPASPGIYELPGGRTQVIGYLVRLDATGASEGASSAQAPPGYAIAASEPASPEAPQVLVVNAARVARDPEGLVGALVVAEGAAQATARDGAAVPSLVMVADNLSRIENVIVSPGGGRSLSGVPPRWARVEKPGLFRLANGSARAVGVLTYAEVVEGVRLDSWIVLREMPYLSSPDSPIAAVLTDIELGDPADSEYNGAYVAVSGDLSAAVELGKRGRVPVVRATDATVLTRLEPTAEESFR